ncbi:MAG: aromatic ring-hydroxylating dioxygenase subunit alpha [Gammaproteobacteria bacterium]|nr:aromatic ring-hydroxylating dioxygenase subunit alpha [Gammaproteobacteria bacterium]
MSTALVRPVEPVVPAIARALPAWVYNHPEMTRLEYERLLKPSWQIVCHKNQLRRAGDFVTFEMGTDSVVVVRDAQGTIRAFHNVCRHRGARLLEGQGHCPAAITCPYHGWSYRHSGELLGISARDTFPPLERAQLGLKPVRMQLFLGFVFVCLAGEPPPLEQVLAELMQDFTAHRFEDMELLSEYVEHWDCDWKVAIDNYLESYHVPIGHPGLYRMCTPDYADQRRFHSGVAGGSSWLREQPSSRWSERMYQQMIGGVATHLPERERRRWSFYSVLPNLGIDVFPEQMDYFQVVPRGPGKCAVRGAVYGLPDERREMRIARYLGARINRQIQREDEWLCRRVQLGLASDSYEPGPLSSIEGWMLEFHNLLRERIPEARLPSPPARFS